MGVVLSGNRDDGTAGLRAIHEGGGTAVVHDAGEHFRAEADAVSRQAQVVRGLLRTGTGGAAATQSGPIED